MKLSETAYDILKWVGRVVLPAIAVLYATLGNIWNFPYIEEVPTTITAIDLFLNTLLGISSESYTKSTKDTGVGDEIEEG